MNSGHLNIWPWKPNNWVDPIDEKILFDRSTHNPYVVGLQYAYFAAHHIDIGDESYGGNPVFVESPLPYGQYERRDMQQSYLSEILPTSVPPAGNGPSSGQLIESLYGALRTTWEDIVDNNMSGEWGHVG